MNQIKEKTMKNMTNLNKDMVLDGYWVNKKSGTIHLVSESEAVGGGKKLWNQTMNLTYTRDYFFHSKKSMTSHGYGSIDSFLKNYEFICNSADVPMDFYHHVLTNKALRNDFTYGKISKKEFFGKIFN